MGEVKTLPTVLGVQAKPPACSMCAYKTVGSGFLNDWIGKNAKVLFMFPSAPADDFVNRYPLSGKGGHSFIRNYIEPLGYDRDDCAFSHVIRCFVNPRTAVFTSQGHIPLYAVTPGMLVLTHEGRFRKVLERVKIPAEKHACQTIRWKTNGKEIANITVTEDHRFLVGGRWCFARNLKPGDSVTALAESCLECGKLFHRMYSEQYRQKQPFCSSSCKAKFHSRRPDVRQRISNDMHRQYAEGLRDPYEITRKANETVREMVNSGWRPQNNFTEESYQLRRLRASVTRETIGLAGGSWIGKGEREVAAVLEAAGYDYTPQFSIDGYNYDFRIGETLIEVDGRYAESYPYRQEKIEAAERYGYRILHVPATSPDEVLNLLQNDVHEYRFIEMEIVSNEATTWNQGVWSLSIDEDESYVAAGLVNHNCRTKGDGSKKARHGQYPTGFAKKSAESSCRYYDRNGVIETFNPDSYLISFELNSLYQEAAFTRLFSADVKKAFDLATRGYRPLVLAGNAAAELLAPFVNGSGGVKEWHGHWDELPDGLPWLSGMVEITTKPTGFRAA